VYKDESASECCFNGTVWRVRATIHNNTHLQSIAGRRHDQTNLHRCLEKFIAFGIGRTVAGQKWVPTLRSIRSHCFNITVYYRRVTGWCGHHPNAHFTRLIVTAHNIYITNFRLLVTTIVDFVAQFVHTARGGPICGRGQLRDSRCRRCGGR
jgi:hypothetical protein